MAPVQFVAIVVIPFVLAINYPIVVEIVVVVVGLCQWLRANGTAIALGSTQRFSPIGRVASRIASFAATATSTATTTLTATIFASFFLFTNHARNFNLWKFLLEPFRNLGIFRQKTIFVELSAGSIVAIIVGRARSGCFAPNCGTVRIAVATSSARTASSATAAATARATVVVRLGPITIRSFAGKFIVRLRFGWFATKASVALPFNFGKTHAEIASGITCARSRGGFSFAYVDFLDSCK
jgi:hypothetical protein